MESKMQTAKIVPDVVKKGPISDLQVVYGGTTIEAGIKLTPSAVAAPPTVTWAAEADSFYVLIMSDPDAPSAKTPKMREWMHWLIVNIPGNKIAEGEVLTEYAGSTPPKGSGPHRYVFLVFKQPGKVTFKEKKIGKGSNDGRAKFNTGGFAKKYKLGDPISGNYFVSENA